MSTPETSYRELVLSSGHVAIVDAEDFDRVSTLSWNLDRNGYPRAHVKLGHSDRKRGVRRERPSIRLHQLVMNANGARIDHRDGNPLNNRKDNLRPCTQQQNSFNRKPQGDRKYKGTEKTSAISWRASLRFNGKIIRRGPYPTEEAAAAGYNELALEYFGEFARLNVVPEVLSD